MPVDRIIIGLFYHGETLLRLGKLFVISVLVGPIVFHSLSASAVTKGLRSHFPVPRKVSEQVWFWERIFSKYTSDHAVIHDVDHPELIIDVVDYRVFENRYNNGRRYSNQERDQLTERYIKRYEKAMARFDQEGKKAVRYGAMEKRIYSVYRKKTDALSSLYRGKAEIRSQLGLADEFKKAAMRARDLLPDMEDIFRYYGLPVELTRLPFVESMFNTKAISKVGASGIWQFMPSTGKRFLIVNRDIDERNSPLKATKAAARYLAENFDSLKSWPLAITAYNHGARGMQRAVKKIGSANFGDIIRNYRSSTFGFASKNFYAEFLAARNVYNLKYRRTAMNRTKYERIKIGGRYSLSQIYAKTNLSKYDLRRYNECIKDTGLKKYHFKKLPASFDIVLPKQTASDLKVALKLGPSRRYRL